MDVVKYLENLIKRVVESKAIPANPQWLVDTYECKCKDCTG